MIFNPQDPSTWPYFSPPIIAHDVGRSRDRSTAVIGGNCPAGPRLLGIKELEELPKGLYGSARASALAFDTFGSQRVIGLQISRSGMV